MTVLVAATVVSVYGVGVASADVVNTKPDPAATSAGPVAEKGLRAAGPGVVNAGPSDVRVAKPGTPTPSPGGKVRDSVRAMPPIKGGYGPYKPGPFRKGAPLGKW